MASRVAAPSEASRVAGASAELDASGSAAASAVGFESPPASGATDESGVASAVTSSVPLQPARVRQRTNVGAVRMAASPSSHRRAALARHSSPHYPPSSADVLPRIPAHLFPIEHVKDADLP